MKRILLVDDEQSQLFSLAYLLEADYELLSAQGGQEALALVQAQEGQLDLIICDLSMPEVNGAHFYLLATQQFPNLENRFIFMTAETLGGYLEQFGLTEKTPLLKKPFTKEALYEVIEDYFSK